MTYLRLQCKLAETYFAQARRKMYNDDLKVLRERGLISWTAPGKGLPQDSDFVTLDQLVVVRIHVRSRDPSVKRSEAALRLVFPSSALHRSLAHLEQDRRGRPADSPPIVHQSPYVLALVVNFPG